MGIVFGQEFRLQNAMRGFYMRSLFERERAVIYIHFGIVVGLEAGPAGRSRLS